MEHILPHTINNNCYTGRITVIPPVGDVLRIESIEYNTWPNSGRQTGMFLVRRNLATKQCMGYVELGRGVAAINHYKAH